MSWLDDNQMPTAGYPNPKLVSTEYSEEDSRDAQDPQENSNHPTNLDRTRRSTRHSHRLEDIGIHTRRRSKNEELRIKEEMEIPSRRDVIDGEPKENGLIRRVNGKLRKSKNEKDEENENTADTTVKPENVETTEPNGKQKQTENNKEDKQEVSSESEEVKKMQTRRRVNNRIIESENYSPRRTRSHKISGLCKKYMQLSNYFVAFISRELELFRSRWQNVLFKKPSSKAPFK